MRFGVLGPILVEDGGSPVELMPSMPCTVLAVLLLNANAVVSAEQLTEALWGQAPPASATASLYNHVMRLRRLLGAEGGSRIKAVAPGYLIQVEAGELDLDVFNELCAEGQAAARSGQWAQASETLAAALGLWRGRPLAGMPGPHGQEARIQRLLEDRSQAFEDRIEADLEAGLHRELISELRDLIAQYPVREAFHRQLMLALYRAGRPAEALEAFAGLRRTLVDELGVEPSPSVRQLHHRIRHADPVLAVPAPAGRGSWFQLPADTRVFTGRQSEFAQLIDLATVAPGGTEAGMVVISAIDGMAGIGKTALAVHAAHRVRDQFPDGQLFLDLHGYTTGLEPLTAGDALDWFLRSLGVPAQAIPQDLSERAAYYRDRLEGTRTLIILDNISSAAQVRPLLPGGPGCLVLVTSRRRLAGLEDAYALALDVLSQADAVVLLHKVAGEGRLPVHHPAIPELIELCGRMPLALRITAARLRHRPALRIEDVVAELRDETARLDQLQDEDRNLTAVFDLSYQGLTAAEQHMFRALAQVPGPDFEAYAAANLAGTDHRSAEWLLESLLDHNLLTQHSSGRYRFHDLIRVYARTLSDEAGASPREGEAARIQLLDYYRHTAQEADQFLVRHTKPGKSAPVLSSTAVPNLPDRAAALAWLRAERANLLAATQAALADQPPCAIALAAALAAFLHQEGPLPLAAATHLAAATTAQDHDDRLGAANAFWELGRIRHLIGDYPATTGAHERAQTLFQELGDRQGEANTVHELGRVRLAVGDYPASAELQEQALVIYQKLGDLLGEANALWELGRLRLMTSQFPASAELLERSLAIYRGLGAHLGEASALWELGRVRSATGDYPAAAELYAQALPIYRELGHRLNEAYSLWALGRVRLEVGDHSAATDLLDQALALFQRLGSRFGEGCALHDLGRVRFAAGDHLAAADLLERAMTLFQGIGDRHSELVVLNSTSALIAETTGPQEALVSYRRALRLAREVGSPLDEGRALEGAARCLARAGDREAALADLRQALALYRLLGAAEAASAAALLAELADAAGQSARSGSAGPAVGGPGA